MISTRMEPELHVRYPGGLLIAREPSPRGLCGSATPYGAPVQLSGGVCFGTALSDFGF